MAAQVIDLDTAWGAGYDCASAGGSQAECPVDSEVEPDVYAEWMAGWSDGNH
jgi:ribosome modulation factor